MAHGLDYSPDFSLEYPPVVHHAAGMVAVQLDCTPSEALIRMRVRTRSIGIGVEDLAEAVVERSIRFD